MCSGAQRPVPGMRSIHTQECDHLVFICVSCSRYGIMLVHIMVRVALRCHRSAQQFMSSVLLANTWLFTGGGIRHTSGDPPRRFTQNLSDSTVVVPCFMYVETGLHFFHFLPGFNLYFWAQFSKIPEGGTGQAFTPLTSLCFFSSSSSMLVLVLLMLAIAVSVPWLLWMMLSLCCGGVKLCIC